MAGPKGGGKGPRSRFNALSKGSTGIMYDSDANLLSVSCATDASMEGQWYGDSRQVIASKVSGTSVGSAWS